MNKKILKKALIILLLSIFLIYTYNIISSASYSTIDPDFILKDAKDNSGTGKSMLKIVQSLLTIIQVVASGVAVIMIIVLAIKYMSAAPGDKADIKKSATVYIVGAIILFSGSGILAIIRKFATKNINNE